MKLGTDMLTTVVQLDAQEVAICTRGRLNDAVTLELTVDLRKYLTYQRLGKALEQKKGTNLGHGSIILRRQKG